MILLRTYEFRVNDDQSDPPVDAAGIFKIVDEFSGSTTGVCLEPARTVRDVFQLEVPDVLTGLHVKQQYACATVTRELVVEQVESFAQESRDKRRQDVEIKREHAERYFVKKMDEWDERLETYSEQAKQRADISAPIGNEKQKTPARARQRAGSVRRGATRNPTRAWVGDGSVYSLA